MKLINPLPRDVSYLYHYTSADKALNYILKNKTLKFNSFKEVNDPRENKEWDISPFVRMGLNLELEQYDAISQEVSEALKANAKLVCFCQDKKEAVGQGQPEALFNRGFSKPSMWHHYANKHNGICLMFDKGKLSSAFKKHLDKHRLVSGKVTYSNKGILTNVVNDTFVINLTSVTGTKSYLSAIQDHMSRWFKELFLTKLLDWADEDEYRWIYFDDTPEVIFVDFEGALEAVVIGNGFPEERKEEILRYCVLHEAEVATLNWRNGFPKIEHPAQPYITHKHLLQDRER